jgi:hypothetical protein
MIMLTQSNRKQLLEVSHKGIRHSQEMSLRIYFELTLVSPRQAMGSEGVALPAPKSACKHAEISLDVFNLC